MSGNVEEGIQLFLCAAQVAIALMLLLPGCLLAWWLLPGCPLVCRFRGGCIQIVRLHVCCCLSCVMLMCALARVLAPVLCCSAGSMHFHGSPTIGYSQFTACSVFVPPSLVLNQTQAARKAEALCRGRRPCH